MDPNFELMAARRSLLHNLAAYAELEANLPSAGGLETIDEGSIVVLTNKFVELTDNIAREVRNVKEISGSIRSI